MEQHSRVLIVGGRAPAGSHGGQVAKDVRLRDLVVFALGHDIVENLQHALVGDEIVDHLILLGLRPVLRSLLQDVLLFHGRHTLKEDFCDFFRSQVTHGLTVAQACVVLKGLRIHIIQIRLVEIH